jgi:hypothetical protein
MSAEKVAAALAAWTHEAGVIEADTGRPCPVWEPSKILEKAGTD